MSDIRYALERLYETIEGLDHAVSQKAENLSMQQHDLFQSMNVQAPVDQAVIAKKLDSAISNIEGLLKEAS